MPFIMFTKFSLIGKTQNHFICTRLWIMVMFYDATSALYGVNVSLLVQLLVCCLRNSLEIKPELNYQTKSFYAL